MKGSAFMRVILLCKETFRAPGKMEKSKKIYFLINSKSTCAIVPLEHHGPKICQNSSLNNVIKEKEKSMQKLWLKIGQISCEEKSI